MVDNDSNLVYPSSDSIESVIQRTIEGIQKMIRPYDGKDYYDETKALIEINPASKRHWESQIKIKIYFKILQEMLTS